MKHYYSYLLFPFLIFFHFQLFSQLYTPGGLVQPTISTNNYIGIGTSAPTSNLAISDTLNDAGISVRGNINSSLNLGNLFIQSIRGGEENPLILGTTNISNYHGVIKFGVENTDRLEFGSNNENSISAFSKFYGLSWMSQLVVSYSPNAYKVGENSFTEYDDYKFLVFGKSHFENKVAIGTICFPEDSSYSLAVKGKIIAEGMKVKLQGDECWADHVFQKGYNLSSLYDVEKFIQKNNHLPEIPSEKELKADGLQVEEMLKLQMQKIEELTLYMIEMKKENDEMKEEIKKLKRKN